MRPVLKSSRQLTVDKVIIANCQLYFGISLIPLRCKRLNPGDFSP